MRTKRAQNAANGGLDSPKLVWRPGSAEPGGGAYSAPPDLLAGFRGERRVGRKGQGGRGVGMGREGEEWGREG